MSENKSFRFGAFIVTYHRPDILRGTIESLLRQKLPPELVLIIDNSSEQTARPVVQELNNQSVSYHPMGYNSGPAGAAYFGLKWFKEKGFDWTYWGDDDNPPEIDTTFERIFKMILTAENIGIAGAVGQRYDFTGGKVVRLKDEILTGYLEVDVMAGASYMVVNLHAVNEKTLPDPGLFFGFEEFEFCLKIKKSGYRLLVDGDLMKEYRTFYHRLGLKPERSKGPDKNTLLRQYYSTRNLIHIFFKLYPGFKHIAFYRMVAAFGKIIFGFSNGVKPGLQNARYQWTAIVDGVSGKLGMKTF